MKTLALIAGILLMAGVCQAAPFLVCDSQVGVTKYIVDIDGVETTVIAAQTDGSLKYDMAIYINTGNHTVKIKGGNVWGWSTYSDPFDFDADTPNAASGVGLSE
jgi:hypothetical protein